MKESITILSNQSLTATVSAATAKTELALSSKTWKKLTLQAAIAQGAVAPKHGAKIPIYYAFSDVQVTTADSPTILASARKEFTVTLNNTPSTTIRAVSQPIEIKGDFLYVWTYYEDLGSAVTLDLIGVEVDGDESVESGTGSIVTISAALPAGNNNIGDVDIATTPVVGAHANAWSAAQTGAGGTSTAVNTQYSPHVSAFGTVDGATTITLQLSQNNSNFYNGPTTTLGGASDFHINANIGAQYVRLKSSADVITTATIAAK